MVLFALHTAFRTFPCVLDKKQLWNYAFAAYIGMVSVLINYILQSFVLRSFELECICLCQNKCNLSHYVSLAIAI